MNTSKLILHCGGELATREKIATVPTPGATRSWCPVPHIELINKVEDTLKSNGMEIVSEALALAKDGDRFFGLLQVRNSALPEKPDYGYVVSLRNSHDKRFKIMMGVGSSAFVCDNLAFSNEIQLARKHTTHALIDLPRRINNAVGQLAERWTDQDARITAYKEKFIGQDHANDIVVRAYEAGVCPITLIPDVLKEYKNPRHVEFERRNCWSLFNAFTECLKPSDDARTSLWQLPRRTTALHGVMDTFCGIMAKQVSINN